MKSHTLLSLSGACGLALLAGIATLAQAETVITESPGTVTEFRPDAMVIRSETATAPTRFVVRKDVEYVDDAGAAVSMEVVRSGLPVTVHYVREGDQVIARRVIVHRHVTTATTAPVVEEHRVIEERPVVQEHRTVIEQRPTIEEHRATTTTTTIETR